MKIPIGTAVTIAAAAFGTLAVVRSCRHEREDAALTEKITTAEQRVATRDSVIALMTQAAGAAADRWRTRVRPGIQAAVETVMANPTPENARDLAAKCSAAVRDCDADQARLNAIIFGKDSTIADKDSVIRWERAKPEPWLDCVGGAAFAGGKAGLGAACGISGRRLVRFLGKVF